MTEPEKLHDDKHGAFRVCMEALEKLRQEKNRAVVADALTVLFPYPSSDDDDVIDPRGFSGRLRRRR